MRFADGDIFDSDVEMLVDPVNCVGVSGAGLAKEFKWRFPLAVRFYESCCRRGLVDFHKPTVFMRDYADVDNGDDEYTVAFVPTKKHWRDPSSVELIRASTRKLVELIEAGGFKSVAVPALGCGYGGLPWDKIKSLLEKELGGLKARVIVYEPQGAP